MNIQRSYVLFIICNAVLLLFPACSDRDTQEDLGELQVTENEIQTEEGVILIRIDDLPGDIPVDDDTRFGAATYFTGATLSPDQTRVAITTSGTSHGAGWMFDLDSEMFIPAAFQYGGSVLAGAWSSDGRYIIFIEKNPASGQTLSIADTRSEGSSVAETSIPIRLPEHDESGAGEEVYHPIKWDGEEFLFEVDGQRYRYSSTAREITEN
jgi:hypothetical protein